MKSFSKKKTLFFAVAFIALISLGILSSCVKQKFDEPPIRIPQVNFPSNKTIDSLKIYYAFNPHGSNPDTMMIKDDIIIQGIINSTDASGNIYKTMYIQDSTGGLAISIDASSLNSTFKLGQRVFIKCKGLYLGTYGGMMELGYTVYTSASGIKSIGRIPSSMLAEHFFLDGLPSNNVAAVLINPASSAISTKTGMLVELKSVKFPDAASGLTFVDNPTPSGLPSNRSLTDSTGINTLTIIVRTSNYANFAADTLPAGVGNLRGILTVYSGAYQLTIRDINDLINFHTKK